MTNPSTKKDKSSHFGSGILYSLIGIGIAINIYLLLDHFKPKFPITYDNGVISGNYNAKFIG